MAPDSRDQLLAKCNELLDRLAGERQTLKLAAMIRDIEQLRDRLMAEREQAAV